MVRLQVGAIWEHASACTDKHESRPSQVHIHVSSWLTDGWGTAALPAADALPTDHHYEESKAGASWIYFSHSPMIYDELC